MPKRPWLLGLALFGGGKEASVMSHEGFDIFRRLPHRYPMLMVDRIIQLEPGKRAIGIKCVSVNEPHFTGHYPERPIMPGVLILEAMAQVGGIALDGDGAAGKIPLLAGVEKARFRKPVTPGDRLEIESTILRSRASMSKIQSVARVDGTTVAEAELLFTLVDTI